MTDAAPDVASAVEVEGLNVINMGPMVGAASEDR